MPQDQVIREINGCKRSKERQNEYKVEDACGQIPNAKFHGADSAIKWNGFWGQFRAVLRKAKGGFAIE
jgi:hypothetical protein